MSKIKYQVGDLAQITCSEISYEGLGTCRLENYAIFTPNLFVNEVAKVKLTQVNSKYAFASVVELITVSPQRKQIQYSCYNSAPLINLNYSSQIEFKNQYFLKLLKWNLGEEIEKHYLPLIQSPREINYRNKVRYPLFINENKLQAGEYQNRSNSLIAADNFIQNQECLNITLNRILEVINTYLNSHKKAKNLVLFEAITLRNNKNDEISALLQIHSDYDLPVGLIEQIKQIDNLIDFNVSKKDKIQNIFTKKPFYMQLLDKEFICNINSFFQINSTVAEIVFSNIKNYINKHNEEIVLDAYCGVGTIGQLVAGNKVIYGSDIVNSAIIDAKSNAQLNHIKANYFVGDSAKVFKKQIQDLSNSFLILDPPRSGITSEFIDWIIQNKVKNIIYMSCDVKTLVRDLKFLQNDYSIVSIQGFDMFPNTAHIEALCILKLK
ncbi:23S rRNA (uracil(1939)-C(5))-methyltransferase RlmD [Mycoplasma seminis]|uniref:23S rRNA (Uracil(1939)-C(5))-methyltransferase RlmD n=1 Tax=Mycoplasma seminis TaxID=512749 RepID=A0ABY9H9N1_9MOLU|nr:23S rRNA (uracil(1939)-C(5))-methyltransferase RlmD [Mycoplasma seminis]WLP85298.1 23S rRNA (uracil(1939)-C(5))-methyltransferase RlmD [Mycoplasma seminis]